MKIETRKKTFFGTINLTSHIYDISYLTTTTIYIYIYIYTHIYRHNMTYYESTNLEYSVWIHEPLAFLPLQLSQ